MISVRRAHLPRIRYYRTKFEYLILCRLGARWGDLGMNNEILRFEGEAIFSIFISTINLKFDFFRL